MTTDPGTRTARLAEEIGTIRKNRRGKIFVALVFPSPYAVGMANLGLQTIYGLLNRRAEVVCERVFLPESAPPAAGRLATLESGRPVAEADIVAFSIAFENDYPNLLALLAAAGLPLFSCERTARHPLVIAGGVACTLNPEPIAPFCDAFLIGEAEESLPAFMDGFDPAADREGLLPAAARRVPGLYVPRCYRPEYRPDGTLARFAPQADVPPRIHRPRLAELDREATVSTVTSPHTAFGDAFLVEIGRGCAHGCRFCSTGFAARPPRFRATAALEAAVRRGLAHGRRIGLVGAAVSDLPGLGELCAGFDGEGASFTFSSLRADALTPGLARVLARSGVKTATIAPEAGSERLRRVINKGVTEEQVLAAAETLLAHGIPNLKLYFMVGLPTETAEDIEAIIALVKAVKHRFLKLSRGRGAIGTVSVSVNSFVPKAFTPFQWAAMADVPALKGKLKRLAAALRRIPNVRFSGDIPRWAYVQGLLARGDRRVAGILAAVHAHGGNWARALKETAVNADFFALRERPREELFPWDFIAAGVDKQFLWDDYQRALAGRPGAACRPGSCRLCGACGAAEEGAGGR